MRQVFYIESDEEILSVVDRLRVSRADETVFVFPQGALVLRSIVNLYLFDREAKKRGKRVTIVTQDEMGTTMAEKVGIPVQNQLEKNEDDVSGGTILQRETEQQWVYPRAEAIAPSNTPSRIVGTEDFFGSQQLAPDIPPPATISYPVSPRPEPLPTPAIPRETLSAPLAQNFSRPAGIQTDSVRRVEVRDRSPQYLTALNSQLQAEADRPSPPPMPISIPTPLPLTLPTQDQRAFQSPTPATVTPQEQSLARPEIHFTPSNFVKEARVSQIPQAVSGFFAPPVNNSSIPQEPTPPKVPEKKIVKTAFEAGELSNKPSPVRWGRWLAFSLLVLVVIGLGTSAWILLPHVDIAVTFKTTTAQTDARFAAGSPGLPSGQSQQIPVRLIEVDKTVSQSFPATGSGAKADGRVHGQVTLSNMYSADPQTLIATTRILSPTGKLFRLKDTVVVPGMHSGQAGTIDTEVVADQTGSEYAIPAGSFTIPGLDGTPKKDKFTVVSHQAFVNGMTSSGALATVSSADIVKAKQAVEKALRDEIRSDVRHQLNSGEQILPETTELTTVSAGSAPLVGVVTDTFQYTWQAHARILAFSEDSVRSMIRDQFLAQSKNQTNITLDTSAMTIEYGQPQADLNKQTIQLNVHAKAVLQPAVSIDSLKQDFLGKSSGSLEAVVARHPEIANVEVDFGRTSFWKTIPSRPGQVTLTLKYLGE